MKYVHIILYIWLFGTPLLLAQEVEPKLPALVKIRNEVINMVEDSIIPSMAVAVIKNGQILWQEALGYSDIENSIEASENSIYPLGSIAKSITATGIMVMLNDGTVDLQGNIQDYLSPIQLKNIDGETPDIPLWQLLSQNAGINHGYGVFVQESLPRTKEEIKNFIEKSTIVAFTPGTHYNYSNHSFDLSELIINKISGKDFETYMQLNLFEPLGMTNTIAYPHKNRDKEFVSTYTTDMKKRLDKNTVVYPAGGSSWWSSLSDLVKYVKFHLGNISNDNIVNTVNLNLMHDFRQGPADVFGIGWFNDAEKKTLYSNGNVDGGNAAIYIDKKNNLAIITLLNKTSWEGIADEINGKIKNVFYEEECVNHYENWKRIYGTPYTKKFDLLGNWVGILKEPVTDKSVNFELNFNDLGEVVAKFQDKEIVLKNPSYNLFGNFECEFKTVIPTITETETKCILKLHRIGNIFEGYIQYNNETDKRFYTMPLFIKISKEET